MSANFRRDLYRSLFCFIASVLARRSTNRVNGLSLFSNPLAVQAWQTVADVPQEHFFRVGRNLREAASGAGTLKECYSAEREAVPCSAFGQDHC